MASCALITYGGGTRNRTGSGRLYHGPLAASQVNTDGRTVPAAGITALLAAYNQFDAAMNTAGYQWVVLSRKDLLVHPISSINVSNIIATQRRRMRS